MGIDWLTNDLWRAHVSWLTPGWVDEYSLGRPDFDAVRWLDQIQAGHYKTLIFYSKFHDGHCTYHSKYSDFCTERDYLCECTEEARKRGVRVLTYFSSVLDQYIGSRHPEWQVKLRDGLPARIWASERWPDAYCCINNPEYRAYMLGQIQEICKNYLPDGLWLDVYSPWVGENCMCPACHEKFRTQTSGSSLLDTHDTRWYASCYVELLGEINMLIKGINPDCVLGENCDRNPDYDPIDDFHTHEDSSPQPISLYCRSMRPLGKPFETTSRLFSLVHSWAMRSPDRVLLESLTTVVHGGACCQEFQPTPTGKISEEATIRVAEVGAYIRTIEPYLVNTSPIYDAGVFQPVHSWGSPSSAYAPGGWKSVMLERDIPFACLYQDANLTPYQLLVLDDSVIPDQKMTEQLAEYVTGGGNLIVEYGKDSLEIEQNELLQEILGIQIHGKVDGVAHYLRKIDERIAGGIGKDELFVEGEACRIAVTTANAISYLVYEVADRTIREIYYNLPPVKETSDDPAITLNYYGKGRALFIACPLTTVELRNHRDYALEAREFPAQFASNLARFMIAEPLLRGTTPAGVEVVVNQQPGHIIAHLLNNYVTGQYYDSRKGILKLADITFSINEHRTGELRRAYQLVDGTQIEMPIHKEDPWAEVHLSTLGVHEMIILE